MGTPNSKTAMATNALADLLIHGTQPTRTVLHALGIDTKMLQATYDDIKEHLGQMDGFVVLEDAVGGRYNDEYRKPWAQLVEEANLTGVRVLRFAENSGIQSPVRLLFDYSYVDIELFLNRNGVFILWDGGEGPREPRFIKCHTVSSLLRNLQPLLMDDFGHTLRKVGPNANDAREADVPLLLEATLHRFLKMSIAAKQHRLAPQIVTDERITRRKQNSGLSS